jgi:hypothetical protein
MTLLAIIDKANSYVKQNYLKLENPILWKARGAYVVLIPFLDNQTLLQNITKYQIHEIYASVLMACSDTTLRFLTENSEGGAY